MVLLRTRPQPRFLLHHHDDEYQLLVLEERQDLRQDLQRQQQPQQQLLLLAGATTVVQLPQLLWLLLLHPTCRTAPYYNSASAVWIYLWLWSLWMHQYDFGLEFHVTS